MRSIHGWCIPRLLAIADAMDDTAKTRTVAKRRNPAVFGNLWRMRFRCSWSRQNRCDMYNLLPPLPNDGVTVEINQAMSAVGTNPSSDRIRQMTVESPKPPFYSQTK